MERIIFTIVVIIFVCTIKLRETFFDYDNGGRGKLQLTKRDFYSTQWIGDVLVWRDYKWMTRNQTIVFLNGKSILFIGDSLSRRLAFTLKTFLNDPSPTPSTLNKDPGGHFTIHHDAQNVTITSMWMPLTTSYLEHRLELVEAFPNYDYVFISIGLHDSKFFHAINQTHLSHYLDTIYKDFRDFPNIHYRLCPYPDIEAHAHNITILDTINNHLRKNLTRILDANKLMRGRDAGELRIKGNTWEHFGVGGRLAIMQATLFYLQNIF